MENHLQRSYPSSKHLYALWEAVMPRRLLDFSMTVRSRACLSTSSKTFFRSEKLITTSRLRLARNISVMNLFLCHSHEAPDMEDRNVQAYRDTQCMDQISPLPT